MRDPAYLKYEYGKVGREAKVSLPLALLLWISAAAICWSPIILLIYWL